MPAREFWVLWASALFAALMALALTFVWTRSAHAATLRASWYGAESGRWNADGSRFEPWGLTAASWSYPFATRLRVCFRGCTIVTVHDRGPAAWTGRALDLSQGAARAIGLEPVGVADIDVAVIGRMTRAIAPRAARRHRSHPRHR